MHARRLDLLKLGLLAALLTGSTVELHGATYYVRKSGSDSNSGRSASSAFRTINKAATKVGAGDTVYVGAGTYDEKVLVASSGTDKKPIRFIADTSGANTGDAGDVVLSSKDALTVDGADYIQVTGFLFAGGDHMVLWELSRNGLLADCELKDGKSPIELKDAQLTVRNCNIHDNNEEGILVDGTSSLFVYNSVIKNASKQGVKIKSATEVVIEDTVVWGSDDHGIRTEAGNTTDTLIVRRCALVLNDKDGFHSHGDSQITLENCLVVGNEEAGIHVHADNPTLTVRHCTVAYNDDDDGVEVNGGSCQVTNSIIAFNGDAGLDVNSGSMTHDFNLVYGNDDNNFDGTSRQENEIVEDPRFISSRDYHLQSTSPAIDQGTGSMDTDLDRLPRPYGAAVDLGCYEYGATLPTSYYVRKSGDDSNSGRSASDAFQTIGKAASVVRAGDMVYVGAGTYREAITLDESGKADEPIHFLADADGEKTGDDGSVIISAPASDTWAWSLQGADYAILEGFRISGGGVENAGGIQIADSLGVTLDLCEIDHNQTAISGAGTGLFIDRCTVHSNSRSVDTANGVTFFKASHIAENAAGPSSNRDSIFRAEDTELIENQSFALHLVRPATLGSGGESDPTLGIQEVSGSNDLVRSEHAVLIKCTLDGNTNGPSLDGYTSFDDVLFSKTQIRNNIEYALLLANCELEFSPTTWGDWPVGKSSGGILAEDCQLKFQDLTLDGFGSNYVVLARRGTLEVDSCRFRKNANALAAQSCSQFSATASQFRTNTGWGLYVSGAASLSSCTIDKNGSGLYLSDSTDRQIDLFNTSIADNTQYGVYAENCKLSFSQSDQDDWLISGNGYGIFGHQSDLTFSGFNISDNTLYGLASEQGTVKLEASVLSGNGSGVLADRNVSFTVKNSKFNDNTAWGAAVTGNAEFVECTINQNATGGLYLAETDNDAFEIQGTSITDNGQYGIYASNCQLTFDPDALDGCQIDNHDYTIFGSKSDLTISELTVSGGNLFGVAAQFGKLRVQASTITGNTSGLYSKENTSFRAVDTSLSNNSEWGLSVVGQAELDTCTIASNTSGLLLQSCADGDVLIQDTLLQDNTDYGVFTEQCTLTFSPSTMSSLSITGSKICYAAQNSNLTFDQYTVTGGSQYGLACYTSHMSVIDSTFSDNGIGLYAENNDSCTVTRSTFRDNTNFGVRITGTASLSDCTIEDNVSGLSLVNCQDGDVTLSNTQITRNANYGVYADSSTITFNAAMQSDWLVDANGSSFGASESDLIFDGFTISGGTTYGLVSTGSNITLKDAVLQNNATGLYSSGDKSLSATGTTFTQNGSWGASIEGSATLSNCSFRDNANGLMLYGLADGEVQASSSQIADNSGYGLYVKDCKLTFDESMNSALSITGNGYGVYGRNSTLTFDQYTLRDNSGYGALLEECDATVGNCSFRDNDVGLYAKNNNSFSATDTQFNDNATLGLQVDGKADLTTCSITGNANGLSINGATDADLLLDGLTVSDNTGYGCSLTDCQLTLDTLAFAGASLSRNGTNLLCDNSTVTLDGLTLADSTSYGIDSSDSALQVRDTQVSSDDHGLSGVQNSLLTVVRSRFDGSGSGWALHCERGDLKVQNTVVDGHANGIRFSSLDGADTAEIYNSTIAGAEQYGILIDNGTATVTNNIIAGSGGQYGLAEENTPVSDHSYNLVHGFTTPFHQTSRHASELVKPPRFVDRANGDLQLAKGSPAINAGKDLSGTLDDDLERNSRPSFRAFEIGAYEYLSDDGSFRVLTWKEQK